MKKLMGVIREKFKKKDLMVILPIIVPGLIIAALLIVSSIKNQANKRPVEVKVVEMPYVAAEEESVCNGSEAIETEAGFSAEPETSLETETEASLEKETYVSINLNYDNPNQREEGNTLSQEVNNKAYALIYCWIRHDEFDRSSKVGELYYGDEVEVLEELSNYSKVKTNEVTGYVRNEYLSKSQPIWVGNLYNSHKINLNLTSKASSKYIIEDINVISQLPDMPSGCELTSLTMALNYMGVNVDKEIVSRYLPTAEYGDNFFKYFIGSIFAPNSLGIYADGLCDCAEAYLDSIGNKTVSVANISGTSVDGLLAIVASNHPVVVWATKDMNSIGDNSQIWLYDGQPMGFIRGEHCMLLVGFDKDNDKVYMADPLKGEVVDYSLAAFRLRYRGQFSQALLVY